MLHSFYCDEMGMWRHSGAERGIVFTLSRCNAGISSGTCCVSGNSVRKGSPVVARPSTLGGGHVEAGVGPGGCQAPPLKGQAGRQSWAASAGRLCDPGLSPPSWGSPGEDTGWGATAFSRDLPVGDDQAHSRAAGTPLGVCVTCPEVRKLWAYNDIPQLASSASLGAERMMFLPSVFTETHRRKKRSRSPRGLQQQGCPRLLPAGLVPAGHTDLMGPRGSKG